MMVQWLTVLRACEAAASCFTQLHDSFADERAHAAQLAADMTLLQGHLTVAQGTISQANAHACKLAASIAALQRCSDLPSCGYRYGRFSLQVTLAKASMHLCCCMRFSLPCDHMRHHMLRAGRCGRSQVLRFGFQNVPAAHRTACGRIGTSSRAACDLYNRTWLLCDRILGIQSALIAICDFAIAMHWLW